MIAASEKNSVQNVVIAQQTVFERIHKLKQRLEGWRTLHCVIVSKMISSDFIFSLLSRLLHVAMIELWE